MAAAFLTFLPSGWAKTRLTFKPALYHPTPPRGNFMCIFAGSDKISLTRAGQGGLRVIGVFFSTSTHPGPHKYKTKKILTLIYSATLSLSLSLSVLLCCFLLALSHLSSSLSYLLLSLVFGLFSPSVSRLHLSLVYAAAPPPQTTGCCATPTSTGHDPSCFFFLSRPLS
jgi:hypothetical protein